MIRKNKIIRHFNILLCKDFSYPFYKALMKGAACYPSKMSKAFFGILITTGLYFLMIFTGIIHDP